MICAVSFPPHSDASATLFLWRGERKSTPLYYVLGAESVLAALVSDPKHGLSNAEAQQRLNQYGLNELEADPPIPAWRKFLAQFQDVLIILLLVAAVISLAVWIYERDEPLPYETLVIFAMVLLNGILGYVQEARAEQSVAALRAMAAAEASVLRDSTPQHVPATMLVPGDIMLLEEGDTIPADGRLIQSVGLQTAEASLTGESLPVSKQIALLDKEVGLGDQANMEWHNCHLWTRTSRCDIHWYAHSNGANRRHAEAYAPRNHAIAKRT